MQITALPITVAYEELNGSPVETISRTRIEADRVLKCAWNDRWTLAAELAQGYLINLGNDCDGVAAITFLGQPYPYCGGVYVESVHVNPLTTDVNAFNGNTTLASYGYAKLDVHYRPYPFDPTVGTFLADEGISETVQVASIPGLNLYWDDARPLRPGEGAVKQVRILRWWMKFQMLENVPSCWLNAAGCVNDGTVTSPLLNRTFAAESLQAEAPVVERVVSFNGSILWNVTLNFMHLMDPSGASNGISWNYILRGPDPAGGNPPGSAPFTGNAPQQVNTGTFTAGNPIPTGLTPFKQYTPLNFPSIYFL